MKTLQWAAAVLAVGALALPARAETTTTTDWWDVTFEPDSFRQEFLDRYPEGLEVGELGILTNYDNASLGTVKPYASGQWTMIDGDESYVTNEFNPTNLPAGNFGFDTCIKLDTQGNDLTWTPTGTVNSLTYLVDADLFLVGSDTAPSDFDEGRDVQTAIYLKNETDEATGETINSVLCVYVFDKVGLTNYWQDLTGIELSDNAWAHVQVVVDHSDSMTPPHVKVFVNGTQMTARGGTDDFWETANRTDSATAGKVSSVSFRGTGAIDNFAGKTLKEKPFDFTAQVYIRDALQDPAGSGNYTRIESALAGAGRAAEFRSFTIDDYDLPVEGEVTYALSKIVILDPVTGAATATYNYTYDGENITATSDVDDSANVYFTLDENDDPDGGFKVTAPTEGATGDAVLVKIYFDDPLEEGDFRLTVAQNVGDPPPDQTFNVNDENLPDEATFTFAQILSNGGKNYVLSTITVEDTPAGIEADVSGANVVVSVPLNDQIADGVYKVATANYVEGTLAEGQELSGSRDGNVYTYTARTAPVAMIGETPYDSLREAIERAADGDTITLLRDDHVSFSATATEIGITKSLTIDGGSNTLYGVSDYAYDGVNDHDIYIGGSGNVTIKNLKISEFSDTAPTVQMQTYPIWTGQAYSGKLTLDGVQIDKFARTAINLSGGTFEITNCVIKGYADAETVPDTFYQDAIFVYKAEGTVAETTVTGVGEANTGYGAAVFTVRTAGTGKITVLSGSYTGLYVAAVNTNATGSITIEGGTFVATNTAGEGEDPDSAFEPANTIGKIVVKGGWFDREPEAEFLAAGYKADKAKPDTDRAPWTVVLGNAIWIGGESGDWNVPANWDIGLVPTTTTVVTFTNDAMVGISPTVCKCEEMVLDGANVTIGRADQGTGADLNFYKNAGSAVSGTGTLALNTVGLFNQNKSGVLTIGTDLDIQGDVTFKGVKDDNGGAGSWTVTGETTIADGVTVKTIDDAITTFQGDIEIDAGSQVTFFAAYGAQGSNHGGEIVVDSTSTVTLASPAAKLLLQTRNNGKITINDSQVVTDSTNYYVKKSSQQNVITENNGTVNQTTYEVLQKRTVVNVAADEGLTVGGIATGDWFVPGTNFVITVTGASETGYEPSVMITNGTSVLLTTNAATFTYTAPDSDIGVVVAKVIQTFDITFKPENGEADIVTNVAYGATSYAPAAPTLAGFTFLGWTNALDATDTTLYEGNPMPAAAADATYAAKYEASAVEHIGAAASENGFMILSPEDPSQPEAPVFTLAPTMNGLNGTTKISASFVKPEGVTSATVKLVYKKSLAADAQKFYADATITNIDLENGTADVAYTLPQDEDTIFLVGFTDGEPAGNGD